MGEPKSREEIQADIDHFGKWYVRTLLTFWIPLVAGGVLCGLGIVPMRFVGLFILASLVQLAVMMLIGAQSASINPKETTLASHRKREK